MGVTLEIMISPDLRDGMRRTPLAAAPHPAPPPVWSSHLLALPVELRSLLLDRVFQCLLPLLDDDGLLDHLGLGLDRNRVRLALPTGGSSLTRPDQTSRR